jgi:hypothetical protein
MDWFDEPTDDALAAAVSSICRHDPEPDPDPEPPPIIIKTRKYPRRVGLGMQKRRRKPRLGFLPEPPPGAFEASISKILKTLKELGPSTYKKLLKETELEVDILECSIGELLQARRLGYRGAGLKRRYFLLKR